MALRLITDATIELVTLPEMKSHMRLSTVGNQEDAQLTGFITAARKAAERITHRSFQQQIWRLTLDRFPDIINVPRPPISTTAGDVTIKYLDPTSGDSTTLPSTAYTIDAESEPARIYPSYNNRWPSHRGVPAAITIDYTAGELSSVIKEDIKTYVKVKAAYMYEHREAEENVELFNSTFFDGMLDDYVFIEVFP